MTNGISAGPAPGLAPTPFWWEAAPRPTPVEVALPQAADVAVVGSGITGLNAALVLARAGRQVVVIEAGALGQGASSRNAGYVGRSLKHDFLALTAQHGLAFAIAIYRELQAAFDSVFEIVRTEQIDCRLQRCGRFVGAASPRQYDSLARELEARRRHLGDEFEMVPRAQQSREIGSDAYFGGAVIADHGALHPGLYHQGLLDRVRASGAILVPMTPVLDVKQIGGSGRFAVVTARGTLSAREVVIATNGYTGAATPWLQRRVIPFDAYMIATEVLAPETLDRVLPRGRTCLDTNFNINFVRRSPDGTRILFGGRTGSRPASPEHWAERLRRELAHLFPDLADVAIAHSWTGRCAATFDLYPHIGIHQGIHYAIGYCFAGVPMGTHLGRKIALRLLGSPQGHTALDARDFPTQPFYRGNPWFVPYAMKGYDLLDRWNARR